MKLVFRDYDCNVEKTIGECKTEEEADILIQNFIKEWGFKSHYMRCWYENDVKNIDFGSHSKFFALYLKEN